jgi:lysophospholipase L1-like esterase
MSGGGMMSLYAKNWRSRFFQVVAVALVGVLAVADSYATQEKEGKTLMAEEKTIVVIGASYAGGWNSDRPIAGFRFINKGIGGQQSFEMLARFETDVLAIKPDAVIIWGFINDVFRSDRAQMEQTLSRTRESILAMVESARKARIMPVLATEVTIRSKDGWSEALESIIGRILGKSSYQNYINRQVGETNRWLRDTATLDGILLLDLEAVLGDHQGVRRKEFSQSDGSHISKQGYEAITQYAEGRLRAVGDSR